MASIPAAAQGDRAAVKGHCRFIDRKPGSAVTPWNVLAPPVTTHVSSVHENAGTSVCREYVPRPWMRPLPLPAQGHFSGRGACFQPSVLTCSLSVHSV